MSETVVNVIVMNDGRPKALLDLEQVGEVAALRKRLAEALRERNEALVEIARLRAASHSDRQTW